MVRDARAGWHIVEYDKRAVAADELLALRTGRLHRFRGGKELIEDHL
jgi:hypothetical protein